MKLVVIQRIGSLYPWEFCGEVAEPEMDSWLDESVLGELEYEKRAVTLESACEDYGVRVPSEALR